MSTSWAQSFTEVIIAKLEQLRDEIRTAAEPLTDAQFWHKPIEPGNSIGHLVRHLTGNLNHFVGAQLGGTGYVRDRDREFNETPEVPKSRVLADLDQAIVTVRTTLAGLSESTLLGPHPEARFGTVMAALVHLTAHFALHRGQISYIVRLIK